VAMNPRAYLADVTLPKLPPEEIQRAVPQAPSARTAENTSKSRAEKVASRPENGPVPEIPGAKPPAGKASSGDGKRRKQGGGVPVSTSVTTSTASTKPARVGAAQ
jgi:hypothetical protein